MKYRLLFVMLPLFGLGCVKPKTLVGNWTIQNPTTGAQGLNTIISFDETDYKMQMRFSTPDGSDIKYLISGTYQMKDRDVTMNAAQVSINDGELSPETKAKYALLLDKKTILENARKNSNGSVRFPTDDTAIVTFGRDEMKLKRTTITKL